MGSKEATFTALATSSETSPKPKTKTACTVSASLNDEVAMRKGA